MAHVMKVLHWQDGEDIQMCQHFFSFMTCLFKRILGNIICLRAAIGWNDVKVEGLHQDKEAESQRQYAAALTFSSWYCSCC